MTSHSPMGRAESRVLTQSLFFTSVHLNLNTNGGFVLAAFGLVLAARASLQRDRVNFKFLFFCIARNNNWQKIGQSHIGSGCAPLALRAITMNLFQMLTVENRILQNMRVARAAKATSVICVMVEGRE